MIYNLLLAGLLVVNAIAILNEDRLLRKYGLARSQRDMITNPNSLRAKSIDFIYSIQTVMRIPLLFMNTITIVVKMLI